MATQEISVFQNINLDGSGDATFEPYSVKESNVSGTYMDGMVVVFNDTANRDKIIGRSFIPQDYVGTAEIVPVWSSETTSNNAAWDFGYRGIGGDDTETFDQATPVEEVGIIDAAPSAKFERNTPTISLTSANLAAGDEFCWALHRNGTTGSDTLADAVLLFDVRLKYSDA